MTVTLFVTVLTIVAMVLGFSIEVIKKAYINLKKDYFFNVIAFINVVVVGGGGIVVIYMLLNVLWEVNNIICMVLMVVCVWIGSMVGYDKIIQLIKQIAESKGVSDGEKRD